MHYIQRLITSLIQNKKPGEHLSGYMVNASTKLLFLHVFSLALGFFLNYVLVRSVELETYGNYVYIFNFLHLISSFCLIGMDTLAVKMAAIYDSTNKRNALNGLILFSFFTSFCISLLLAFGLFLGSNKVFGFVNILKSNWLIISAISLILFSFSTLSQSYLQAFKLNVKSQLGEKLLKPLLILCGIGLFSLWTKLRLDNLIWLNILVSAIIVCLNLFFLRKRWSITGKIDSEYNVRFWLPSAIFFFFLNLLYILNTRLDIFLLGIFKGNDQVGVYNITLRISELINLGIAVINFIIGPLIAQMFERKEMKQLQNLITRSAQFTAIIGIPVALLIIAFREYILRFFGVDFLVGETSLQILVLGQLINVLFGSVGMLLLMTGNQRFSIISLSVSIAINIGLNCLLTPRLGITGTAIASASGIFVWNLSMYFFVRKKLHIRTTAFSFV